MSDFDSDEDFSYTNSAKIYQSLKQKLLMSHAENCNSSRDLTPTPPTSSKKVTTAEESSNASDESEEVFEILDESGEEVCEPKQDALNETPVDIIGTIDSIFTKQRPKRKTRSRTRLTATPKRNRRRKTLATIEIADNTPGEDDVNVKVFWKSSTVEKFVMKPHEDMTQMYEFFSCRERISCDRLLFTLDAKSISQTDTVQSLGMTAASIIDGGTVSESMCKTPQNTNLELKVQHKNAKHPIVISMKPNARMRDLMTQCARHLKVDVSQLKFYLDGDLISEDDSPKTLDLEGGECIDCIAKS